MRALPRIVFVLGKGGVGRSTVATSLGLALGGRGERILVFEWTIDEAIAPWFDLPAADATPREIAPRLSVANYDLNEALRAYFVDHLRLGFFYRHVVNAAALRRLIEAAPGIAELLFLGQLWWLTSLAEQEAGLAFDRIVVDAPATGHGASLLDMSATLKSMGAAGLLGREVERVAAMMRDPSWTGAVVVAQPEELVVEETLELVPRATRSMNRAPIAAFVNRSVDRILAPAMDRHEAGTGWLEALYRRLSPAARDGLEIVHDGLEARVGYERALRRGLAGATSQGIVSLDDTLAASEIAAPREIVRALAGDLDAWLEGGGA